MMSMTERKSVLNPSLLRAITQAFFQSTPTTSSPPDQVTKLPVTTPRTSSSIAMKLDVPQIAPTEFA